ncbi:hypothetical protein ACJIZ3_012684 [Penstemon smallii]|uniref:Uncharacterized protein n=1 Tax=Penstemon smallii TaxID=265156 RepID=A0ABD3UMR7_9LAMI
MPFMAPGRCSIGILLLRTSVISRYIYHKQESIYYRICFKKRKIQQGLVAIGTADSLKC